MTDLKFKSWSLTSWPLDVYPNSPMRARRVLRVYREELAACGAISRVGREIVVFAEPYIDWVIRNQDRVASFKIPTNTPQRLATREAARKERARKSLA